MTGISDPVPRMERGDRSELVEYQIPMLSVFTDICSHSGRLGRTTSDFLLVTPTDELVGSLYIVSRLNYFCRPWRLAQLGKILCELVNETFR